MARRRPRIRRTFGAALLCAALLSLLELNNLLPGGWPGGGGQSAFRTEVETGDDARRLRPGTHEATWPSEGVKVTVRRADGTEGRDWHLDLPDGRRLAADEEGQVRLGAEQRPEPFFGVTLDGRTSAHTPADPTAASEWVVHVPADAPEASVSQGPRGASLHIVAAETGAPLAGATVEVLAPGWERTKESGADGQIPLALLPGPQEAIVRHPDRLTRHVWLHPDRGGTRRVELEALRRQSFAFVDADDGEPAPVDRFRLLAPDGSVLFETVSLAEADLTSADLEVGVRASAGAVLELGGGDYPFHRLSLSDAGGIIRLSKGRRIEVQATSTRGERLKRVRLKAIYVPPISGAGPGLAELVEVEVPGQGSVVLPRETAAEVLVEAAYSTPRVVTVAADATGSIRAKLEPSQALPVTVADEAGAPLVGATVIVRAEVDGRLLEREARTDAAGAVRVPELPATALEVYAHAKGRAWGVQTAKATQRMAPIAFRLPAGRPIRIVAETPLGIPLARVRVRAEPEGTGVPTVVAPHASPWLTDASGALVLPDLRVRPYRLMLSHPDARPVHLERVVPGGAVHFVTLSPR